MKAVSKLKKLLDEGKLLSPVDTVPSAMELYRTIARYSGIAGFPKTDNQNTIQDAVEPADHIIFAVVDGLGMKYKKHFNRGGFFDSAFKKELRSIFPSTTASALTSLASCAWPSEHSIIGWWNYFAEISQTIAPLIGEERETGKSLVELEVSLFQLVPVSSFLPAFFRQCQSFLPKGMHKGPYIDWSRGRTAVTPYKNLGHALKKIDRYIKRLRSPSYTYVYIPDVDTLSHEFGTCSPEVLQAVEESDRFLSDLRSSLPDSVRIAVTADHGAIDVDPDHYFLLHHDDPIHEYLEFPPTAESRNPVFHVKTEKVRSFRRYFNSRDFGDHFLLITPDEAEKLKLYGPERLTKKCRSRLGNFIAVAESKAAVEYVPKDREAKKHKGFHGGLHPEEMRIPFFEA